MRSIIESSNSEEKIVRIVAEMVRYGTVRYGTVRYGTVRYGTVRYGTVRYGTVRYGRVRYGLVWNDMVRYTLFKSWKHVNPNNTQLVSREGVFCTDYKINSKNCKKLTIMN